MTDDHLRVYPAGHAKTLGEMRSRIAELEAELAEARKDGERLDEAARGQYSIRYNAMNEQWEVVTGDLHPAHRRSASRKTIRAAIDAARGAK